MAVIATNPVILNDVQFLVVADNYESSVSAVEFTPATSTVTWKGMTPSAVFSFSPTATWTCTLTFAQDWTTTNSLSQYLLANEGTEKVVKFFPKAGAAAKGFQATVIITPGSIGGSIDSVAVATVTLAVKGKPTSVTSA